MTKKVNKKTFNTATATKVAFIAVGSFGDDTGYEEVLYKTKKGDFFMYVNGGSASKYPVEDILAVDEKEAKEFVKNAK